MSKFDLISRGTLVFNPSDITTISGSYPAAAGRVTAGFPAYTAYDEITPTHALKLSSLIPTDDSFVEANFNSVNIGVTSSTFKGIFVEVYNPNPYPIPFRMELRAATSYAVRASFNMCCEVSSGWQLLWMPKSNTSVANTFHATDPNDSSNLIARIRPRTGASFNLAVSGWGHNTGDILFIGRIWSPSPTQVVQRPVFLLCTDDGTEANVIAQTTPNPRKTYLDILEHYGFRGTFYIVPSWIGTAGFMTIDHLKMLRDKGHTIGSHSYSHPQRTTGLPGNPGLRLLGPLGVTEGFTGAASDDSAIYTDVVNGVEWLFDRGFQDAAHFALPQGGWDSYVRTACLRAGLTSVRAISNPGIGYPVRGSLHVGGGSSQNQYQTGWIDLPGAIQLDGTPTQADILAYVNEVKRLGATGLNYTHYFNGLENFDYLCDILRTAQDAGEITVMTAAEYYDATRDWGGRCKFDGTLPSWEE